MRCERCGEHEATIHVTDIQHGKPIEKHLCESCAQTAGIDPKPSVPISELLSSFVVSKSGGGTESGEQESGGVALKILKCDSCGLTFAEFKQTGLLGCPECYTAFEEQLGPLIARAHEGATHHIGKIPQRAYAESRASGALGGVEGLIGSAQDRTQRMATLRHQLNQAVSSEQYELAARIQEEMQNLGRREERAAEDADAETEQRPNGSSPDAPNGPDE